MSGSPGVRRGHSARAVAIPWTCTSMTKESMDGLFTVIGEQEQSIRSNPAARTTDLLKKVFGGT